MKKYLFSNKLLYFFYKLQKIYKNKSPNYHFAEFAEDVMVNRIFKNYNEGIYIDVGAYHPYKSSLTYKLFKRGWRGMNIDLSKTSIDLFDIARPKDLNICCAISNKTEKKIYFENSPINQQNSLIPQSKQQKEIKIQSYKLSEILKLQSITKVDYINIDTEGNELKVLYGLDFSTIDPFLLTIEDNSFDIDNENKKEKINYLEKNKYKLINIIGVTMFFVKKDSVAEISKLIKI